MIFCGMLDLCRIIFGIVVDLFRPRAALEAEILVLQQIIVLRRDRPSRVPFLAVDKMVLGWVCQLFPKTREALAIVRPDTVVRWHRAGFRCYWAGIDIGQTSVAKYMARRRGPPSQGWKTFLRNHADGVAAMDLFVVPTVSFRLLYGLLIMSHGRRQILWLGVTAQPTAEWIANQLTAACGWEQIPRDLIRDRDACYGSLFVRRVRSLGIRDHPTSARSPWQNGYAERLIGSIRRECLNHIVGEQHLRHPQMLLGVLQRGAHASIVRQGCTHWRDIQCAGRIEVRPVLGGLHHHYVRI